LLCHEWASSRRNKRLPREAIEIEKLFHLELVGGRSLGSSKIDERPKGEQRRLAEEHWPEISD